MVRRGAEYGPSWMSGPISGSSCGNFKQITGATFSHGTPENHEHVNAWADAAKVGIATGGDVTQ